MKDSTKRFKEELNCVFDDNLHTKQWHNVVDWLIISLIMLSTIEIFLSTFDVVSDRYGRLLNWIDLFTQVFFTIEVTLRIWNADMLDPKYKGFKGRLRYCCSFYGLIDILATYPFYLSYFVRVPFTLLKTLRVVRLLRVFRYMHSFQLLSKAINSKKSELLVSLNFLVVVTVMMSFVLFFVEHEVQPEVYENGWSSVVWAFAQYIGDPGGFADMPPMTLCGKIIACLVGIMGIAIVAVPAGLVGSAFTDVMDEEKHEEEVRENIERIEHAFRWEKDQQHTGLSWVPAYKPIDTIMTKQFIPSDAVVEAVANSDDLHLYNLAKAVNAADSPMDRVVVVNTYRNRPYGCCIDRGSKVTIVSTSGHDEPITTWVAYHVAKLGGFNFVSKDVELSPDDPVSYYNISDPEAEENLKLYLADINALSAREGAWVVPMCFCIGPKSRPHQIHLVYSPEKGDEGYSHPKKTIQDVDKFDGFVKDFTATIEEQFGHKTDCNKYYRITSNNIAYHLSCPNVFALRIESRVVYFAANRFGVIKAISDLLNKHFEPDVVKSLPQDMANPPKKRFGMRDYIG